MEEAAVTPLARTTTTPVTTTAGTEENNNNNDNCPPAVTLLFPLPHRRRRNWNPLAAFLGPSTATTGSSMDAANMGPTHNHQNGGGSHPHPHHEEEKAEVESPSPHDNTTGNNNNNNRHIHPLPNTAVPIPPPLNAEVETAEPGEAAADNDITETVINRAILTGVVEATQVATVLSDKEEEALLEGRRRCVLIVGALACLCMALVIILPLMLTNIGRQPPVVIMATWSPSSAPSQMPTLVPTQAPTAWEFAVLLKFLQDASRTIVGDAQDDPWWTDSNSPPYKAALWLFEEQPNTMLSYSETKLIQRFALATFYYSTTTTIPTSLLEGDDVDNSNLEENNDADNNSNNMDDNPPQTHQPPQEWTLCGPTSTGCAGHRWLSVTDECTWQYVSCQNRTRPDEPSSNSTTTPTMMVVTELNFPARGNSLQGTLPPQLSLLSHLQVFSVANNNLVGGSIVVQNNNNNNDETNHRHAIDYALAGLSTLQVLILFDNDFSSTLPTHIWAQNPDLQVIVLNESRFTGRIPSSMGGLSKLRELQLQGNQLTGTIPRFLGDTLHASLTSLNLGGNDFSGSIPEELYDLTQLTRLVLSNNAQLTGTWNGAQMGQWSHLRHLQAGYTRLMGTLPSSIFRSMTQLQTLHLEQASLEGSLSSDIRLWNQSLQRLRLNGNQFRGTLPTLEALEALTNLQELQLQDNMFVGNISETMCAQRGDGFQELAVLKVDCQVECTCCDEYNC